VFLATWFLNFSLCLSSALDAEHSVLRWFVLNDKIKTEALENEAYKKYTCSLDNKHICPVSKQSFQRICELNIHSERAHITLELDELPKHSKISQSNIMVNMKKLTSNLPRVLDTQNIESSSHLLDTRSIERSKTCDCSESSKCKKIILDKVAKCVEYLQLNCSICSKWFLHEERLKLHLLEHSSDDILECPVCN